MNSIDVSGQRFGKLVAISVQGTGKKRTWLCKCDCGVEATATASALRAKQRTSCGCARLGVAVGEVYGCLTVESIGDKAKYGIGSRVVVHCKCRCGGSKSVFSHYLTRGTALDCGCGRPERLSRANRRVSGMAAMNRVMSSYRSNSARRKVDFDLTNEQMISMFGSKCHYCASPPRKTTSNPKSYGQFTYNGIDRLTPSLGYVSGNVVPCCYVCNYLKNDYTESEFLGIIHAIARVHAPVALST